MKLAPDVGVQREEGRRECAETPSAAWCSRLQAFLACDHFFCPLVHTVLSEVPFVQAKN